MGADRAEIVAGYPFALDRFQLEAFDALDAGHHVVVAAPTGSGKTVVAEYGIETTRRDGRRAFYTAPLKALSNQKFRDLASATGRAGRAAHRRQLDRRRRPGGGDDHRGAAQHDLRRVAGARPPRAGRPRRGALPAGRLSRTGVGGGDHPPARPRPPRVPLGDGEQLRRAGRVDPDRPRPDHPGRRAAPTGAPPRPLPRRRPHQRPAAPPRDVRRRSSQPRRRPPRRLGGAPRAPAASPTAGAGQRAPGAVHAGAGRDRRAARSARTAAGDRVHLQPQPVRRGRPDVPGGRDAAHHRARARPHPRDRRRPAGRAGRRRSRRARLRPVPRPARGRHRRPPRRDGPGVQGGGRSVLHRGADQGRVRHRDAGRRRQHAGPDGGDREADQVHRRPPRDADRGGVHAAHRAGRPAGDRRGGPRRRAVEPVRAVRAGRRARRQPDVPSPLGVPAHLQHGRQPRRDVHQRGGPPPAQPVVRPVPGRPRRRPARGPARAGAGEPRRGPPAGGEPVRRHLGLPASGGRDARPTPRTQRHGGGRHGPAASGRGRPRQQGPLPGAGRGRRQRPPQGRAAAHHGDEAGRPAAADGRRLRRRPAARRHDPAAGGVQPEPHRVPP